jgi:hypothetical protein
METFVDVLGCFEDLCLENVVGIALGLQLELDFIVFEFLLDSLIFLPSIRCPGPFAQSDIKPA